MMSQYWFICVSILMAIQLIAAPKPARENGSPLPISRSLTKPRINKNLEDRRLGQEYIEQYQEMMRASQESFENFDEKRLRRLIGDDDLKLMAEAGGLTHRRYGGILQSALGRRRARSEAIRRDKLNVQGLRSHKLHSKRTNLDYAFDSYDEN